jgi:nucleotide-binding universal stress UspA family protein
MYKKIMVPLDGSKRAEAILPHVEELAYRFNSAVIFLQVVEPPKITGYEGFDPQLYQQELEELSHQAETYLKQMEGKFGEKNITVRTRIEHGSVVGSILSVADELDVSLVAMASHGRGGLSRVFYGSVAAGVLQRVDRPLLLIRSRAES